MKRTMSVTVVVPCYNEADSIPHLLPQLDAAVAALTARGVAAEVIIVDDGSRDDSPDILSQASAERPYLKVILLARNFGQTAAMAAGFDAATGEVIVPLDADLQNDPADILHLLDKLDQGYDVVSGWRRNRSDTFVTRKIPSWLANRLIARSSGVRLHDLGCTLKAYRRNVISGIHLYGEMHRFIPVYAAQRGARIAELEVSHHPRRHGHTKYGLGRVPNVLLDLMLCQFLWRYGTKPMHVFGKFGLASLAMSFLVFVLMLYFKLRGLKDFVETPLPVVTVTFFLVGCLSLLIGLLAEITMRTYYESSRTATYVVREVVQSGRRAE